MGKPASQHPGTYLKGSASKAVDGDTRNFDSGNMCAHTKQGTQWVPAWWSVDLGDTFNLTGIMIYNRNQHGE